MNGTFSRRRSPQRESASAKCPIQMVMAAEKS
jgi:hypothetical protein